MPATRRSANRSTTADCDEKNRRVDAASSSWLPRKLTTRDRACPVCAVRKGTPLYANSMSPIDGLDMSYRVAQCSDCGFLFADRLPDNDTYARYYGSLSKYDTLTHPDAVSDLDRARVKAIVALFDECIPKDAAIADLGCGSGILLNALRQAGWNNLSGIDPAPGAPERARTLFGLERIYCGTLDKAAATLDLAKIDVVCLTAVLEHLPNLYEDMVSLLDSLPTGAMVLVEVPAAESFTKTPFEPYGEFSLEHIQYFSSSSLSQFFHGLACQTITTRIASLPTGTCDSLLGLFLRAQSPIPAAPGKIIASLNSYIEASEASMQIALQKITQCKAREFAIYGAGSHTARLLPRLCERGESRLQTIVDGNPNLQGKRLGRFLIEAPQALDQYSDATILVSSYRSQDAIACMLKSSRSNPVLTIY